MTTDDTTRTCDTPTFPSIVTVPSDEWIWHGYPGHFIAADSCKFRLCTQIGDVLVSTVGDMPDPLKKDARMEVGCDRFFETMVFPIRDVCESLECGCGHPFIYPSRELAMRGYQTAHEAREGHHAMCAEWASYGGLVPVEEET